MPRINISIPAMKLQRIDDYCKEKGVPRSKLLVRAAMMVVNAQPKPRCNFCKRPSLGEFEVQGYDYEQGDINQKVHLCEFHLEQYKKEMDVREI